MERLLAEKWEGGMAGLQNSPTQIRWPPPSHRASYFTFHSWAERRVKVEKAREGGKGGGGGEGISG